MDLLYIAYIHIRLLDLDKEIIMTKHLTLLLLIGFAFANIDTMWTKTYGGVGSDRGRNIHVLEDGSFLIIGETESYGNIDIWVIKTDYQGNQIWNRSLGGFNNDIGYDVIANDDNSYVILAETESYGNGNRDICLIKLNNEGDQQWIKTIGGAYYDVGYSFQKTMENGYIILGATITGPGNVGTDLWLVKTDADGNEMWSRTFGGEQNDGGSSIQQTFDGGFILLGSTASYGNGNFDMWLIKTDADGNEMWSRTFGGEQGDAGLSIQQTFDGGFILLGFTGSYGNGSYDMWLIKTDADGNEMWSQTFGGESQDFGHSVKEIYNGGYILTGTENGNLCLIQLSSEGITQAYELYGGNQYDQGFSVQQTPDNGYIITGSTESYGNGHRDVWLIRTGEILSVDGFNIPIKFKIHNNYPNPFNPITTLQYDLPEDALVNITIYDMMGSNVKNLVNKNQNSGYKSIKWNATNNQGEPVSAGVYLYKIQAGDFVDTKKMIFLK